MKRFFKIAALVIATFLTIALIGTVMLMSPSVQSALARKVIDSIGQSMDGEFHFSSLAVRPFDAVVINDFVWTDNHPYRDPEDKGLAVADTVAKASSISISFNAWGLLKGRPALIKDLRIHEGEFFLVNEPDGNNLKRIFSRGRQKEKKEPVKIHDIEFFRADYVNIDGFRFRMINHRNPKPSADRAMNWTDLDVQDIHLIARNASLKGIVTEAVVEHLDAREKSGYVVNHISGKARVYNRQVRIDNLVMQDYWSDIRVPAFKMNYDNGIASLNNFIEEVRIQADIKDSRIYMESIAYFAPTLHRMDIAAIIENAAIDGYVSDMKVQDFRFHTPDKSVSGTVSGEIIGIPNTRLMKTDYDVDDLTFTPEGIDKFVKGWAPGVAFDFKKFLSADRMSFRGKIRGPLNEARISGRLSAPGNGEINTSLKFGHLLEGGPTITIDGNVDSHEFNTGLVAGTDVLGPCTMHGGFRTDIGKGGLTLRIDSLKVDHLRAMDYDYTDLVAAGTYSGDAFDGTIFCNDPNINFMFNGLFTVSNRTGSGAYKFVADLAYANLEALNIDKRGRSELSLHTTANFKTLPGGDILGNILIGDVTLTNEEGTHDIGNVSINSYMKDDVNKISLNSGFATINYSGTGFVDSFANDIIALSAGRQLPSLFENTPHEWSGNTYSLDFEALDTKSLLSFIAPSVWIADGTRLGLSIDERGELTGKLRSQRLAVNDKYLKDITLDLDGSGRILEGLLSVDELKLGAIRTLDNTFTFSALRDSVSVSYGYDNNTDNSGSVKIGGKVSRTGSNINLKASILPSRISMNSTLWEFASSPVSVSQGGCTIERFSATSSGQSLTIRGGLSKSIHDTLRVTLDNFDMSALAPLLGDALLVEGRATGRAMMLSPFSGTPPILANLTVENAGLGGEDIGTIKLGSMWDASIGGYKAVCRTVKDSLKTMDFIGHIIPETGAIKGSLDFDGFRVAYFEPILTSVFSKTDGKLSGHIEADGHLGSNINLESSNLRIDGGLLRVAFTNVPYNVDGNIRLDSGGVTFEDVSVRDRNGATGKVTGGIGWTDFKDYMLDIGLEINGMQVVDLQENMNPSFYGNISATGTASLKGPIEAIMLKAEAATTGDGQLHIPMNASNAMSRSDLLVFKTGESEAKDDPYEELMQRHKVKVRKESHFGTEITVQAHPGIEAIIEIDKASGNVLSGRGNGNIQLNVSPSDGAFTLGGNYVITDGTYHFAALGIAKKDFTILDGGSVRFAGDVMDTDLNIRALYRTKTSLATLLSDTTSTTTRRWVECGIDISDKLRAPKIEFTIDIPDVDPTTAARIESALNTEDKIQKQFLSLLISGGFLPDEPSGIVNNSSMIGTTVAELMASQLSNVLQKLDIPIDLGLDYQQNSSGADIFEVAVSTQLFNNRISINGTFGNKQSGATSRQDVLGDLEAEIKLTRNGSIRAIAFHRTSDEYTNYLDNLKRNGAGISFQTEFNTTRELLQGLFPWLFRNAVKPRETAVADEEDRTIIVIDEDD